jgi:hypothetical protein
VRREDNITMGDMGYEDVNSTKADICQVQWQDSLNTEMARSIY